MISLHDLILQVLKEENVSGGAGSVWGPGAAASMSKAGSIGNVDSYATGDARRPKVLGSGKVIRRNKITDTFSKKKKKK